MFLQISFWVDWSFDLLGEFPGLIAVFVDGIRSFLGFRKIFKLRFFAYVDCGGHTFSDLSTAECKRWGLIFGWCRLDRLFDGLHPFLVLQFLHLSLFKLLVHFQKLLGAVVLHQCLHLSHFPPDSLFCGFLHVSLGSRVVVTGNPFSDGLRAFTSEVCIDFIIFQISSLAVHHVPRFVALLEHLLDRPTCEIPLSLVVDERKALRLTILAQLHEFNRFRSDRAAILNLAQTIPLPS